jgi:3-oxoacyl-[acyl-carrier protein] reductase
VRGLAGRRALVTGAARGLGLAAARRMAEEGATVAISDVDVEAAREAAARLGEGGFAVALDVTDSGSVRAGVEAAVGRLGGLDVLVNNAGIARDGLLEKLDDEDWSAVIELNLGGYYRCTRAALPHLRESPAGRIVNMSSRAYLGNPGQANYSAAKAGVIGLTRALSMELGRHGITVNAVAPGMIDTDLVRSHPRSQQIIERAEANTPLRRIGRPEEVAAAIAFLASDDAAYISGDVLHVTGGRY